MDKLKGSHNSIEFSPPEPASLLNFSLGYDQLIADLFWLEFVQYLGDKSAREVDNYSKAESFLNMLIALDPHFLPPYYFSVFILGNEQHRPDVANKLVERGIKSNPGQWQLPFIAGFNQYLNAKNRRAASILYEQASRLDGAPTWLSRQAKILVTEQPSMAARLNILSEVYQSSSNVSVREFARTEMIELLTQLAQSAQSEDVRRKANERLKVLR